uniref:Hexosyltransferase n=1 Tax=Leptobrachium leishanense TaxID=445787 RepID=A0A8C5WM12_9ANUR
MPLCTKRKFFLLLVYVLLCISLLIGYVYYLRVFRAYPLHEALPKLPVVSSPREATKNHTRTAGSTQAPSSNVLTPPPNSDPNAYLTIQSYRYIINEPDKCKDQSPFFIFLITTIAKDVGHREAIRNSWANKQTGDKYGVSVIHLFMLGFEKEADSSLILKESETHHDIIQKDFQDSYRNLTYKTIMGMEWISTYCPQAKYAMKTDSDMFVNTDYLLELLQPKLPPRQNFMTGFHMRDPVPHRSTDSKWYVSFSEYPDERYPDFCSGTGYVFSADLAPKIFRSSSKVRFLYLEDVFVAVCLANEGVKVTAPPAGTLFNIHRVPFSPCGYNNLITSHFIAPNEIQSYWSQLQERKGVCSRSFYNL